MLRSVHRSRKIGVMCGRYVLISAGEVIAGHFNLERIPIVQASYNIAPTRMVRVVRVSDDGRRECVFMRWGFIPAWARSLTAVGMLNNARAESIATKPAFRGAYKKRRCIIPADGYFEWDEKVKPHQPYYFRLASGELAGLAGLWETWRSADGEVIDSFAVVTREANDQTRAVHDRMPQLLAPTEYTTWLEAPDPGPLLVAPVSLSVRFHPVARGVNRVAQDEAANIAVADVEDPRPRQGSLL
ncbi:MAG: SOS response-associated peptidase [Burkholderiales bacterium]